MRALITEFSKIYFDRSILVKSSFCKAFILLRFLYFCDLEAGKMKNYSSWSLRSDPEPECLYPLPAERIRRKEYPLLKGCRAVSSLLKYLTRCSEYRYNLPRPCWRDSLSSLSCQGSLERHDQQYFRQPAFAITLVDPLRQPHRISPYETAALLQGRP